MKSVDRGDFVQEIQYAYENDYQLIGYGASISSPNAVRKNLIFYNSLLNYLFISFVI